MAIVVYVKIGTLEIGEPDITDVYQMGMGFPGFLFRGIAPEEKGKRIVDQLNAIKQEELLECEALTDKGSTVSGYGKLEDLQIQVSETAPITYRFSAKVRLSR